MDTTALEFETYRQVREGCGYFFMDDWALVSATGKDTLSFLQTQTTNDVLELKPGQGQNSAITDRKAKIIATFSLHRLEENTVIFLVEKSQKDRLVAHLEAFIFREDVKIEAQMPQRLVTFQGPKCFLVGQQLLNIESLSQRPNAICSIEASAGPTGILINRSFSGDEGIIFAFEESQEREVMERIKQAEEKQDLVAIDSSTRDILRIEAGIPLFGKDIDGSRILPETGLEHTSVSYNKGCYIGQEVIARIKTYGSPATALTGLVLSANELPAPDADIHLNGKKIGVLKSVAHSPHLNRNVAFAYLQKDYRTPDQEWDVEINSETLKIKTVLLPFYQMKSRQDHAEELLQRALKIYKEEENLDPAIALLRQAVELAPKYAQAYEALGVMLSKQDKLDEAIALMKRLAEIDPSEIMAHTNLSIYYMKQGRIEDAENEKAEATALQFEKMLLDKKAEKAKKAEQENKKLEMIRKIDMFHKVLDIDPVDQVANYGLGSVYFELEKYEEALGPLEVVVRENPDYSAAYLLLGKNLEKLSRPEEAAEVYKKGIAAASKKGDLMPLKDMQMRMNQILSGPS